MPDPGPYQQSFRVHAYEADPEGRLTPRSLCLYLQEAAAGDAARLGVSVRRLLSEGVAWVLQRLKVEVSAWPRAGSSLSVATWAWEFGRVVALRDFEVRDPAGALLAAATSRWVVVDMRSRRAVRLPDFIRAVPLVGRRAPVEISDDGLPAPDAADHERRFEVRRSDLDAARHVNNTRYVEWALETLPDGLFETHEPAGFEIVFRREANLDEVVLARSAERRSGAGRAFSHELRAAGSGSGLALAASLWRPIASDPD